MSILIKGMEMPPDGRYTVCITHDSNGGIHWVFQNQDTLEFLKHGAVTEAPEPHGRLIDADALKESFYRAFDMIFGAEFKDLEKGLLFSAHILGDAPTVIPASEEGET